MGEWKSFQVGEIGKVITGKTPKTSISDNYGGYIPFLTPSDDMSVKYVRKTAKTLTEKGLSEVKNAILPANSVCVSCIGSDLGKVVITTRPTVTNQQINSIVVDEARFDISFVYYAMRILGKKLNFISKTSTAVPIVNKSSFSSYEIECPSLKEQKQIAAVLSVLDAKIECNRMINDNLADLLQTIYQGRFGNDILAVNQGVLSDICSYSTDKVAVSELNVRTYFSTENMLSGKAGSTEATSLPTTSQTTACHKGDTLISNIRPYFKKIVYCEDKCGCSTDVLCFTPSQPCYSAYLFSTLYADKFFAFMVAGSKGTKMPRGDKQQIMTYPVVLPSEEELAGFNTIASPLLEQIYSNRAENKRLSILRDTLLPKLMSGEINVSAIQL